MSSEFGPAESAREQLRRWDAGQIVWSIEMGGIGPGYEQSIQVLVIEIIRDEIDRVLPKGKLDTWGDGTVSRIDVKGEDGKYSCGGFSGAQVGVAKNLAYNFIKDGPAKCLASIPHRRHIQVSNYWPHVPGKAKVIK